MDCFSADCASCAVRDKPCRVKGGTGPNWCPTTACGELLASALAEYREPGIADFALAASVQEGECYANRGVTPYVLQPAKSRIEELVEFSNRMGYRKLGLAFCGGMAHEAGLLSGILRTRGFVVVSVTCKVGAVPKETIGVKEQEKVRVGEFEPMCNPISQARFLDAAGTDFNIMLGLCIGHDSLFLKHIKGLTTVFAVKDRVTGHNPLAPLYTSRSYYQRLLKPND